MASFIRPLAEQLAEMVDGPTTRLDACVIHLLKDPVALSPATALADCTAGEANFTGYTAATGSATPPGYPDLVAGGVKVTEPTANFTVGGPVLAGNDIVGFYVTTSGGSPELILAAIFTNPVSMQVEGEQLNLDFSLNYFGDLAMLCQVNGLNN